MTDIQATKERLLAKRREGEAKETLKSLDFTPLIDHLKTSLKYVSDTTFLTVDEMEDPHKVDEYSKQLRQKTVLKYLLQRIEKFQDSSEKNIHLIFAYLMPEIFDYAAHYEPTTSASVSKVYSALALIFCNLTGDKFYGQ